MLVDFLHGCLGFCIFLGCGHVLLSHHVEKAGCFATVKKIGQMSCSILNMIIVLNMLSKLLTN